MKMCLFVKSPLEVEKVETATTAQNTAMAQKISRFEKQDNTRKSEDNTAAKNKPTLCTEVEKMLKKKYENRKQEKRSQDVRMTSTSLPSEVKTDTRRKQPLLKNDSPKLIVRMKPQKNANHASMKKLNFKKQSYKAWKAPATKF